MFGGHLRAPRPRPTRKESNRPDARGSLLDRISAFFVGGAPQLKDDRLVYGLEEDLEGEDPGTVANGTRLARSVGRQRLATAPCGEVFLRVSVCRKKGGSGGEEPIPRGREDEED